MAKSDRVEPQRIVGHVLESEEIFRTVVDLSAGKEVVVCRSPSNTDWISKTATIFVAASVVHVLRGKLRIQRSSTSDIRGPGGSAPPLIHHDQFCRCVQPQLHLLL